jgi:UDP-glucose:(heptosyl)LPS alpha-1,3-glucosyltransferase
VKGVTDIRRVAIAIRRLEGNTGAVRHARMQIRRFCELGAQVDVYGDFLEPRAVVECGGVPHVLSGRPLGGYWRRRLFDARARRRIRKGGYDLVVGHGDVLEQDVLCMHNCVHLAHELAHGSPLPARDSAGRIHTEVIGRKRYRLLVANSELMKRELVQRYGLEPGRIGVLYRGHDTRQFDLRERDARRPRLRGELGVAADELLVGLVTSGDFEKRNVALFLRGASKLPVELRAHCRFLVVGHDRTVERYRRLASELGIGERVHFSDAVAEVQDVYHALDIYVLPARIEEFGRSCLEALACALPVIVSEQVGCAELLRGESRDFVLAAGEEGALVRRLSQLVSQPERRHRLSELNHTIALENTERHEAQRFEALLRAHGLL